MLRGHFQLWKTVVISRGEGQREITAALALSIACKKSHTHCATQVVVNFFSQIIFKIIGDQLSVLSQKSEGLQSLVKNWNNMVL